jgi:hypothetical protein
MTVDIAKAIKADVVKLTNGDYIKKFKINVK